MSEGTPTVLQLQQQIAALQDLVMALQQSQQPPAPAPVRTATPTPTLLAAMFTPAFHGVQQTALPRPDVAQVLQNIAFCEAGEDEVADTFFS